MKRIFTLLFAVVMTAMTAMAEDYTDNLSITVYGSTSNQEITITAEEQSNGKYKFALNDFSFAGQQVGDIVLEDVDATENDGIVTLTVKNKTVKVTNPGETGKTINRMGGVKLTMTAKISKSAKKMYAQLDMTALMVVSIKATFGDEKNITTSIKAPQITSKPSIATSTIYNLAGQQVGSMTSGNVYIVKTTDGKTKKVIKK